MNYQVNYDSFEQKMKNLGDDLLNGLGSLHPNQAFIQATMKEGEVIGVQSKLIQNRGV